MPLTDAQKKHFQKQIEKIDVSPYDEPPNDFKIYQKPKLTPEQRITMQQAMEILKRDNETDQPATTTYLGVPILQEHSIRALARKILSYVQFKQFCAISNVGKSGAGKTTFSSNLVHEIHTIATKEFKKTYTILWVGKEELANFDEWLKSLPHCNIIMIFEDVSYSMEIANRKNKLKIKEAFTHIRHELGDVEVVCIFHYHYSRAFDKMMRDSYYSVYTSLGKEEKGNLVHIHGGDKTTLEMLSKFAYRLKGMDELGYFTIPIDTKRTERKYVYWTQNPFQIALTDQHGDFHFTMYASAKKSKEVTCQLCSPTHKPTEKIDASYILDAGCDSFGEIAFMKVARWWCFMRGGVDCLRKEERRAWDWLDEAGAEYFLDPPKFAMFVKGNIKQSKQTKRYKKEPKYIRTNRIHKAVNRSLKHYGKAKKIEKAMTSLFDSVIDEP